MLVRETWNLLDDNGYSRISTVPLFFPKRLDGGEQTNRDTARAPVFHFEQQRRYRPGTGFGPIQSLLSVGKTIYDFCYMFTFTVAMQTTFWWKDWLSLRSASFCFVSKIHAFEMNFQCFDILRWNVDEIVPGFIKFHRIVKIRSSIRISEVPWILTDWRLRGEAKNIAFNLWEIMIV